MSDQVIYHAFRGQLIGDTLIPLGSMKCSDRFRSVYVQKMQKYIGRERLLNVQVPFLHCTWKDVLFLSAIPPSQVLDEVANAIREVNPVAMGHFAVFRNHWQALSIPLSGLDTSCLSVYFPKEGCPKEYDFFPFSQDLWGRLTCFSDWTKQYYRKVLQEGQRPMYWNGLPHILYRGEIPIDREAISSV